ncbi:MAG: hypothetical protein UU81_C0014G0007 [Microgenomates group bacterium GW2011_GWC1_41_8]|uniref:Uncharacterized protein n=2 Tax=Candidatus Roizmaniibacteriota TaxID=1752723 RepID=A0A0G0T4F6_9BACT|nr:MAG: hypothetical protein UU14_C0016G0014 [Candidatus Roizmanbacteria bacterium GW2011_GWB1_40_7]KKR93921.1 MAG: hypothetical protein UU41_C0017G0014 [Candidatus Roizmanbacteria bacterium GW2011_GWA1_41_13]KKS23990.1 MAG: hypothetical protein UU81_C0014G0007 [Microgenomates group bacterium GW2011_GWC1_41_8]OGK50116.1 MAG: hypothetical protein A3A55_00575 [Candidatus Roizmanbacteria bacterium RIFCSPLOWO2_01_FULL_40_14]
MTETPHFLSFLVGIAEDSVARNSDIYAVASEIAAEGFGDDFTRDMQSLNQLAQHAKDCGCQACQKAYFQTKREIEEKYYLPSED